MKNSRIGERTKVPHLSYLGDADVGADTNIAAGNITMPGGTFIEGFEMTAPSAPAANGARLYFQDNGAGKTQLLKVLAGDVWPNPSRIATRRYRLRGKWQDQPHDARSAVVPERGRAHGDDGVHPARARTS